VGLAFGVSQMRQAPIFRVFDVRLAVSDMLRSTPTTLSEKEYRSRSVAVLTPSYGFPPQHIPGFDQYIKCKTSRATASFFSKLSGFLALTIVARHAKNQGRFLMVFLS